MPTYNNEYMQKIATQLHVSAFKLYISWHLALKTNIPTAAVFSAV